jgi:hypothetical protein
MDRIKESSKVQEILNKYSDDIKNDRMINKILEAQICFNGGTLKDDQKKYWNKFRKTDIPLYFKTLTILK